MIVIPKNCIECPLYGSYYDKGNQGHECLHPKAEGLEVLDDIPEICPLREEELVLGPIGKD